MRFTGRNIDIYNIMKMSIQKRSVINVYGEKGVGKSYLVS